MGACKAYIACSMLCLVLSCAEMAHGASPVPWQPLKEYASGSVVAIDTHSLRSNGNTCAVTVRYTPGRDERRLLLFKYFRITNMHTVRAFDYRLELDLRTGTYAVLEYAMRDGSERVIKRGNPQRERMQETRFVLPDSIMEQVIAYCHQR